MNKPRFLYMATADARGHLMRAQILTHALRSAGVTVDVMTTSDAGQEFLAGFDIESTLLSRHYAIQFDSAQNMLRRESNRNILAYIFRPGRMLRDIFRLRKHFRQVDLVINDSFHPALLFMGLIPKWRKKIVHVYGVSLRAALEDKDSYDERLPKWMAAKYSRIVSRLIDSAHARIEHDFAFKQAHTQANNCFQLPTPVVVVAEHSPKSAQTSKTTQTASVYLNPHFKETSLADALEQGLSDLDLDRHCVGEGYANRPGWIAQDTQFVQRAINSELIISAPGMASLSIAMVYDKPIILIRTDQPEQITNANRATELGLHHEVVVWQRNKDNFHQQLVQAAARLLNNSDRKPHKAEVGHEMAAKRVDHWVTLLLKLAR